MKTSFKQKLLATFLPLSLVVIFLMTLIFFIAITLYSSALAGEYSDNVVNQVDSSLNDYVNDMGTITNIIEADEGTANFFNTGQKSEGIKDLLNIIISTRDDIVNIHLLKEDENGFTVLSSSDSDINPYIEYEKTTYYTEYKKSDNRFMTSSYVQNMLLDQSYYWTVSIGVKVYDEKENLQGMILIDINYNNILNICNNAISHDTGYVYIVNNEKQLMYHPKQQYIYSDLFYENYSVLTQNSNSMVSDGLLYTTSNNSGTGWKVVSVVELDSLENSIGILPQIYLFFSIVFLLTLTITSIKLSQKLSKPIIELKDAAVQVSRGNFDVEIKTDDQDEIGQLAKAFKVMLQTVKKLISANVEKERLKRKSELAALKAQINPHFLYNTLGSIVWMSELGRNTDVVSMTNSLAKMLRSSIEQDPLSSTVSSEIANVENYLLIQKYRYNDKLNYSIDVSDDFMNISAEHLMLQPIVENCIIHALKGQRKTLDIYIVASSEDNCLKIDVIDNGKGISPEKIEQISSGKNQNSIGINNIHKRIQLRFGSGYGIEVSSKEDVGTKISLRLPLGQVATPQLSNIKYSDIKIIMNDDNKEW